MKHPMDDKVKKLDAWDISLTKLATAAGIIIVLKLWVGAMNWVHDTNIWWFVAALVIFAFRPLKRVYFKR